MLGFFCFFFLFFSRTCVQVESWNIETGIQRGHVPALVVIAVVHDDLAFLLWRRGRLLVVGIDHTSFAFPWKLWRILQTAITCQLIQLIHATSMGPKNRAPFVFLCLITNVGLLMSTTQSTANIAIMDLLDHIDDASAKSLVFSLWSSYVQTDGAGLIRFLLQDAAGAVPELMTTPFPKWTAEIVPQARWTRLWALHKQKFACWTILTQHQQKVLDHCPELLAVRSKENIRLRKSRATQQLLFKRAQGLPIVVMAVDPKKRDQPGPDYVNFIPRSFQTLRICACNKHTLLTQDKDGGTVELRFEQASSGLWLWKGTARGLNVFFSNERQASGLTLDALIMLKQELLSTDGAQRLGMYGPRFSEDKIKEELWVIFEYAGLLEALI